MEKINSDQPNVSGSVLPSDEHIDILLEELEKYCSKTDVSRFGFPYHDGSQKELRNIIKNWINKFGKTDH